MNIDKIKSLVKQIKVALDDLELELQIEDSVDLQSKSDFDELKSLLELWPEAVLEFQIVKNEDEKLERAESILGFMVDTKLEGKKFLDLGCGEGHVAMVASKEALFSVGYDLDVECRKEDKWEITNDFEKVQNYGPYDVILIYDVIDHSEDPVELLIKASNLLSEKGVIYLRCHPWCSRHASHLYKKLNKAFIHLVFTEDELSKLDLQIDGTHSSIIYPMNEYDEIFRKSNLKKIKREADVRQVEDFFKNNKLISDRLIKSIPPINDSFPNYQLSICFIDYVLEKL